MHNKILICYFSGTGNTKLVAEFFMQQFVDEIIEGKLHHLQTNLFILAIAYLLNLGVGLNLIVGGHLLQFCNAKQQKVY